MTLISSGSIADYQNQLQQLAPNGNFWPTEPTSIWVKLINAFAKEFARIDASAVGLINEAFPDTTDVLLDNWMRVVGLPDACSTGAETDAQKRLDVVAKLTARGGQSAAYYERVILAMGYRSRVGGSAALPVGVVIAGVVYFTDLPDFYFAVIVLDPVPDHAAFECRINLIKPAHTVAVFVYE